MSLARLIFCGLLLGCATRTAVPSHLRQLPEVIEVPQAPCPATVSEGVQGIVVLAVLIRADGSVGAVRIEQDIGGGCGEFAAGLVRKASFRPAFNHDGQAVDHEICYEFEFRSAD